MIVVRFLLESGSQVNKGTIPPIYSASEGGNLRVVQILLDHGADVNQPTDTEERSSPLIAATCDDKYVQVTQLLINRGADLNYQDNYGNTALTLAAKDGCPEQVKILVQSQSNLNVKDKLGNTPLHRAVEKGHVEVIRQLLHSQAKLDIKNNAGKTPLQVAEEKKYSEIIALLKTGVLAPGEGEREGKSDRSSETEGDQDVPPSLTEAPKDDYKYEAQNSLCLVYLPQEINKKLSIETVSDISVHPKIASNEILITPVVRITSDNMSLSLEKPAVIELAKTIELSDKDANNKVIPLYANSESSEWKELGSECNCKVLKNRVSFQVTHFSLYAVISRKPYPSSTVRVKPVSADIPAPEHLSTPTELTVPELPGFKVQIPPSSLNADRETNITATVLYDCPAICSEDERSRLASSCIELEPHGITFAEKVSISIPIPDYAEVMKNDPNAKLQIWHADKRSNSLNKLDWTLIEHCISRDREGRHVAIVLTEQFFWYISLWDWAKSLFITSTPAPHFEIRERCQVFMSPEMRSQPSQDITFSIAVLFYPYKEEPEPVPCNYKYMLLDSGLLDLEVANNDSLVFQVKLSRYLLSKEKEPFIGSFIVTGHQGRHQKAQNIELDSKVELQPGLPIGELTFGIKERPEETHQTLSLIKPIEQTPTATRSTQEFEDSIVDAAKKLKADAIQYERSPIVETAKSIASMWLEMALLLRKKSRFAGKFKEEIVDLAKNINKESQEVVRIATCTAEACMDERMKQDVYRVVKRIETLSHQLRHLAMQEATRKRDKASDLEACQILTTNADNLTSAISKALYHTHSASIRVPEETREELGLTNVLETDQITGKHYKDRDDRSREGDNYQDAQEGSKGHTPQSSSRADLEEPAGTHLLGANDFGDLYSKLEGHAAKWRDIGRALGFKEGEMNNIEGRPFLMRQAPNSWLGEMLTQWLEWAPGDGRGSVGFATRDSLRDALLKVNLGQLAQQFQ